MSAHSFRVSFIANYLHAIDSYLYFSCS